MKQQERSSLIKVKGQGRNMGQFYSQTEVAAERGYREGFASK